MYVKKKIKQDCMIEKKNNNKSKQIYSQINYLANRKKNSALSKMIIRKSMQKIRDIVTCAGWSKLVQK
jgi:hypothetical protein